MNEAQEQKLEDLVTRFNCPGDWRTVSAFELPAEWVCVIIGENKGRPLTFGIDPEGRASS